MSRLIYTGDVIKNLGEYLPSPFIDLVTATAGQLVVDFSFSYKTSDFFTPEEGFTDTLQGLYYYVFACTNRDVYNDIVRSQHNITQLFSLLADGSNEIAFSYNVLNQEDIEYSEANLDEADNPILKATGYQATIPVSTEGDLYVLAFTGMDYNKISFNKSKVASKFFSDATYEPVYEDGQPVDSTQQAFFDENDFAYNEEVNQSISGDYHKTDDFNRENIITMFEALNESYQALAETDSQLQGVIDNVSYVLSAYAATPEMLPQMNVIRKSAPQKTNATNAGKYYKDFKKTLAAANDGVTTEEQVSKKMFINPRVIDLVYSNPLAPAAGSLIIDIDDSTSPEKSKFAAAVDSDYVYSNMRITREYFSLDGSNMSHMMTGYRNSGFAFFDYEKYLQNKSALSKLFDVKNVMSFFGHSLPSAALALQKIKLERINMADSSRQVEMSMETSFDDSQYYPLASSTVISILDNDEYYGMKQIDFSSAETTITPYFLPRNFVLPTAQSDETDYRLMALEFQDLYPMRGLLDMQSADLGYKFSVSLKDNTIEIADFLITNFNEAYAEFEEYYQLVSEKCSHNSTTGEYNQFFVDQIEEFYSNDLGRYPWVKMPIIYNLHLAILLGGFEGDLSSLSKNAQAMTALITPFGGTYELLTEFRELLISFKEDYYDSTSFATAYSIASSSPREVTLTSAEVELPSTVLDGDTLYFSRTDYTYYQMNSWSAEAAAVPIEYDDDANTPEELLSSFQTALTVLTQTNFEIEVGETEKGSKNLLIITTALGAATATGGTALAVALTALVFTSIIGTAAIGALVGAAVAALVDFFKDKPEPEYITITGKEVVSTILLGETIDSSWSEYYTAIEGFIDMLEQLVEENTSAANTAFPAALRATAQYVWPNSLNHLAEFGDSEGAMDWNFWLEEMLSSSASTSTSTETDTDTGTAATVSTDARDYIS